MLFSDRGTPATYRHMNGYSGHTLRFVNKAGKASYVQLHYKTEVGARSLSGPAADALRGADADHATRDLYEHIAKGGESAWRMFIQVMPEEDAVKFRYNPFVRRCDTCRCGDGLILPTLCRWLAQDITKVWPHTDYPLIPVGRLGEASRGRAGLAIARVQTRVSNRPLQQC